MDALLIFTFLILFSLFGSLMKFVAFIVLLFIAAWVIRVHVRKYLEKEDPSAFRGIPFPLWMHALIFVTAFFPAYIITIFLPTYLRMFFF